jgi:hypothetical protein
MSAKLNNCALNYFIVINTLLKTIVFFDEQSQIRKNKEKICAQIEKAWDTSGGGMIIV